MMMSALSKKYKNKIWETGAGHYCLVLVESRHICTFMSNDKPSIFFERINFFFEKSHGFFFSIRVFFQWHWQITEQQGKGRGSSFISLYHFHPLTGIFYKFYQITDPCSDPRNLSKTMSRTHQPRVYCAIEYSFLKRNLYDLVQNFSRAIFVRFNTNLMIVLKIEFEQVMHLKVGWFLF